jgi:hypothetical protein
MNLAPVSLGVPLGVLVAVVGAVLFLFPRRRRAGGMLFAGGLLISATAQILTQMTLRALQH